MFLGGGGEGAKRGWGKKMPIFLTNFIDVMVSNVFFGCEILYDCEIQWSSMKGYEWNIQFFKKLAKYEPFESNIINIVVGNLMIVTALNRWLHVIACDWSLNIPRSQWCFTFDTSKVMTFTIILCTYFFFNHVSLSSHSNRCSALANSFYPLL